jgi:hypothetical protein
MRRLRLIGGIILETAGYWIKITGVRLEQRGRRWKRYRIRERQYSSLSLVNDKAGDRSSRRKSSRRKKAARKAVQAPAVAQAPVEAVLSLPAEEPLPKAQPVAASNNNGLEAGNGHNGHRTGLLGWRPWSRRGEGEMSSLLPNPRMKSIPMDNDRRTRYERNQSY